VRREGEKRGKRVATKKRGREKQQREVRAWAGDGDEEG